MVERLNRVLFGWVNYFCHGQVRLPYTAVDADAIKRLRRCLCGKHRVKSGGVRFSAGRLRQDSSLECLKVRKRSFGRETARSRMPGPENMTSG